MELSPLVACINKLFDKASQKDCERISKLINTSCNANAAIGYSAALDDEVQDGWYRYFIDGIPCAVVIVAYGTFIYTLYGDVWKCKQDDPYKITASGKKQANQQPVYTGFAGTLSQAAVSVDTLVFVAHDLLFVNGVTAHKLHFTDRLAKMKEMWHPGIASIQLSHDENCLFDIVLTSYLAHHQRLALHRDVPHQLKKLPISGCCLVNIPLKSRLINVDRLCCIFEANMKWICEMRVEFDFGDVVSVSEDVDLQLKEYNTSYVCVLFRISSSNVIIDACVLEHGSFLPTLTSINQLACPSLPANLLDV